MLFQLYFTTRDRGQLRGYSRRLGPKIGSNEVLKRRVEIRRAIQVHWVGEEADIASYILAFALPSSPDELHLKEGETKYHLQLNQACIYMLFNCFNWSDTIPAMPRMTTFATAIWLPKGD
jgi:hypothetical protein